MSWWYNWSHGNVYLWTSLPSVPLSIPFWRNSATCTGLLILLENRQALRRGFVRPSSICQGIHQSLRPTSLVLVRQCLVVDLKSLASLYQVTRKLSDFKGPPGDGSASCPSYKSSLACLTRKRQTFVVTSVGDVFYSFILVLACYRWAIVPRGDRVSNLSSDSIVLISGSWPSSFRKLEGTKLFLVQPWSMLTDVWGGIRRNCGQL